VTFRLPAEPKATRTERIYNDLAMTMQLERQLKIALDETRLLILGAQVLFGFQFNGVFQEQFKELPYASQILICAGLFLLVIAIALLIAPSMQHRIVERGQDSPRVLVLATLFAGTALLPISFALALDIFVAMERLASISIAVIVGAVFFVLALICWYLLEWIIKRKQQPMQHDPPKPTPLETQVDQLLTEARVIIPGVQALLGFQLTVTLTRAFQELPTDAKVAHAIALCCIGLAVILLMAPASLHRISFGGQDDPEFLKIASAFVIAAPLPLALGIGLDSYVAAGRALQSERAATVLASGAVLVLLGMWYAYPLWRRMRS
jgi:hypothetical protein